MLNLFSLIPKLHVIMVHRNIEGPINRVTAQRF